MTRRARVGFALGLLGFYGFFAHGYLENTDAEVTMHAARALLLRGDPGLQAEGPGTWTAERFIARAGHAGMTGAGGKHYVWFPIGHQVLMVPCVALGEVFAAWLPGPEERLVAIKQEERGAGALWGEFFWARFFVSWLPVLAAVGSTLMIWWLARTLGCSARESLLVTAAATLCTQFWPGASETMSDAPGMFFLLAMAALVFRYRAGHGGAAAMALAGAAGGWAVLVRYPHALPVLVVTGVAALAARERRRPADLAWLLLGALPEAAFLLAANVLRFDSLTETGYSAGADREYWDFDPLIGAFLILLAPGKGVLWFSPPLWIALAQFAHRRLLRFPWLPTLLILVVPLAVWAHAGGWAAGQCWGVRYMTPAVVLAVAVGLALGKPWRRRPGLFAAVCALGLLVSLGGVLTPYRGQQQLALRAGRERYAELIRSGQQTEEQIPNLVNVVPRFSPLHTHWIYAGLSASGRLQRGGSENTTEPLFGVEVEGEVRVANGEDLGFRHLWMPYLQRFGMPLWPVLAVWLLATAGCLGWSLRRLLSAERTAPSVGRADVPTG